MKMRLFLALMIFPFLLAGCQTDTAPSTPSNATPEPTPVGTPTASY